MTSEQGLLRWADAKAAEVLLMGPLCRVVRAESRWILRLHFEAALTSSPFTLIFHAFEGEPRRITITFARLPVARSAWAWRLIDEVIGPGPSPRALHLTRETRRLTGAHAARVRRQLEHLEPWRMKTILGGGTDGYGVRVDFRSAPMNVEASFDLVNLHEGRREDAHALCFLARAFRSAATHLDAEESLALLRMALTDHLDRWP